jgi:hypothetical protein
MMISRSKCRPENSAPKPRNPATAPHSPTLALEIATPPNLCTRADGSLTLDQEIAWQAIPVQRRVGDGPSGAITTAPPGARGQVQEGIETQAQFKNALAAGADMVQGSLLGVPLSSDAAAELVVSGKPTSL